MLTAELETGINGYNQTTKNAFNSMSYVIMLIAKHQ